MASQRRPGTQTTEECQTRGDYTQEEQHPGEGASQENSISVATQVEEPKPKPVIVIGVDFGTTFSGFAYAHYVKGYEPTNFPVDNISSIENYPDQNEAEFSCRSKTITALWYDTPKSVPLWGWPAFIKANNTKNRQPWQYQTRFKLHLTESTDKSALDPIPEGLDVVTLIADYLRGLKEFAIVTAARSVPHYALTCKQIKWCLTVPAQWQEKAKRAMYLAAVQAGMIQSQSGPDNGGSLFPLSIVLEHEAASFLCFNKSANPDAEKLALGQPYMIVDCGGSTVNVSVLSMQKKDGKNRVKAVLPVCGGLCGGSQVDENFFQKLKSKVKIFPEGYKEGQDLHPFDDFRLNQPPRFFRMMKDWETHKSLFKGDNWMQDLILSRPFSFLKTIDLEADDLLLLSREIEECFDPVIGEILDLVDGQLAQLTDLVASGQQGQSISTISVVGGFGSSEYLKSRMIAKYNPNGITITPFRFPESAIMSGAVLSAFDSGSDYIAPSLFEVISDCRSEITQLKSQNATSIEQVQKVIQERDIANLQVQQLSQQIIALKANDKLKADQARDQVNALISKIDNLSGHEVLHIANVLNINVSGVDPAKLATASMLAHDSFDDFFEEIEVDPKHHDVLLRLYSVIKKAQEIGQFPVEHPIAPWIVQQGQAEIAARFDGLKYTEDMMVNLDPKHFAVRFDFRTSVIKKLQADFIISLTSVPRLGTNTANVPQSASSTGTSSGGVILMPFKPKA